MADLVHEGVLAGPPNLPIVEGIQVQGAGGAGAEANGAAPNGAAPNGAAPNGAAPNGAAPNGAAPNGVAPNGAAPNGAVPNGAVPNGAAPNGAAPNGAAPNGAAPNGAAPNGAAPNGAAPNGAAPNGAAPNGAAPNGAAGGGAAGAGNQEQSFFYMCLSFLFHEEIAHDIFFGRQIPPGQMQQNMNVGGEVGVQGNAENGDANNDNGNNVAQQNPAQLNQNAGNPLPNAIVPEEVLEHNFNEEIEASYLHTILKSILPTALVYTVYFGVPSNELPREEDFHASMRYILQSNMVRWKKLLYASILSITHNKAIQAVGLFIILFIADFYARTGFKYWNECLKQPHLPVTLVIFAVLNYIYYLYRSVKIVLFMSSWPRQYKHYADFYRSIFHIFNVANCLVLFAHAQSYFSPITMNSMSNECNPELEEAAKRVMWVLPAINAWLFVFDLAERYARQLISN